MIDQGRPELSPDASRHLNPDQFWHATGKKYHAGDEIPGTAKFSDSSTGAHEITHSLGGDDSHVYKVHPSTGVYEYDEDLPNGDFEEHKGYQTDEGLIVE